MKKLSEQSYAELMSTIQQEVDKTESGQINALAFDIHNPEDIIEYLQRNNKKSILRCKEVNLCKDDFESTATILLYYADAPQDKVYLDYIGNWGVTGGKLVWEDPTKVHPIEVKTIRWESVPW